MTNRFSKYVESDTDNEEEVSPSSNRFDKYVTPVVSKPPVVPKPPEKEKEKVVSPDTAPPPILSTDVTGDQASQLLEPYTPPEQIGGFLEVEVPETKPELKGWESMVLGKGIRPDIDLSTIEEEFEIPKYKYNMDELKKNSKWNELGKKVYERLIKKDKEKKEYYSKMPNWQTGENLELFKSGKLPKKPEGMSVLPSGFQSPSDITGDITKPKDQSYGEWLAEYMSKSGYDFTSQILTVVDINNMSKAEKMDQAKAMDMWINTSPSISSTLRAGWHTISDPVNAFLLFGAGILSKVAPKLAGKLGISAASALQAELTQLGVTKKLAKKLVSGKRVSNKEAKTLESLSYPKKLSSGRTVDIPFDSARVAEMKRQAKLDVAKSRLKLAPVAGVTWSTVGDYIEQEKEIAAGVPDYGKLDGDKIEKSFIDYYVKNENKLLKQPENKGLSTGDLINKLRSEHYQKEIFLPENVKTEISGSRLGQAGLLGIGFGTFLGAGGYTLGIGMRKFSNSRARQKGTYREGYKTTPEVESALVGKLDDNNQPVFTNTYESLPDLQGKHIIGTHIKKGTSSEDIFNEAVNINNILLPQTKDRDGGIVQVSVDRGTSKRELQDIKNKFRLANIDLREVTPEPRKPVGKPVSKKVEDRVVRKLAEGKPLTKSEQKLVEKIQEQAEIREANRQIKEDGPLQFEGVKVDDTKLSVTGRPLSSASPVHVRSKDVVETDDVTGQPLITQRNIITEYLAGLNTILGRGFKSAGSMPEVVSEITKNRKRAIKKIKVDIKHATKKLKNAQEEEGMSNEDLAFAINEDVLNVGTIKGENYFVPPRVQYEINNLKRIIQANEDEINNLLGLTGEDRIGLGMSGNRVYFTRTYEASFNPKYYDKIEEVLGDPTNRGKYYERVKEARDYFKNLIQREEGESDKAFSNRVDGVISGLVSRVAKEDVPWFQNIWSGRVGNQLGEYATKVLKERQNLDVPILNLLGEVKNPYHKITATLMNQNSLLSEINFLKQIEDYALRNLDKIVDLEGLIPGVPVKKTSFSKTQRSGKVTEDLGKLVDESIGKFGSRFVDGTPDADRLILQNIFTTKQMADLIRHGTDLNFPDGFGGELFKRLGRVAAFGQAGQTILDPPSAYLLNLWGAVTSMMMNGYLIATRPTLAYRQVKDLYKAAELLWKGFRANDPAAVKEIGELKAQGVIESDVVSENIIRNIDIDPTPLGLSEEGRGSLSSYIGDAYNKGMTVGGGAYAAPDSWSKIIAHRTERNILRDIFTVKDRDVEGWLKGESRLLIPEEELFKRASGTVRRVMPSYGDAWPFAKALGRVPVGTYALFPSEITRTSFNIPLEGIRLIDEGQAIKYNKTYGEYSNTVGNKLMAYGAVRLMYPAAIIAGIEAIVNTNNEAMNITNAEKKGLDLLAASWGSGANRLFLKPLEETRDGRIIGSFVASTQFDAYDTVKLPIRQTLARYLSGEEVSEVEMKKIVSGLKDAVLGPYINEKFLYDAILNVAASMEIEQGRPLYSKVPNESAVSKVFTGMKEILGGLEPGGTKMIDYWWAAYKSEKHRRELQKKRDEGEAKSKGISLQELYNRRKAEGIELDAETDGRSAYGFPLSMSDLALWTGSGIRPNTFDLKKAIGYNLSKDIRALGESPKEFLKEIARLPDAAYTKETEQKIIDIYNDFQNRNYEFTSELSDKARIFSNMKYTNLKKKQVPLGIEGVLAAASNDFWYDISPKLLLSNLNRNIKQGYFRGDNPLQLNKQIIKIFRDKGWTTQAPSILKALGNAYQNQAIKPLEKKK